MSPRIFLFDLGEAWLLRAVPQAIMDRARAVVPSGRGTATMIDSWGEIVELVPVREGSF